MSTARRTTRWGGALVNARGQVLLLRSTTGSVVFPAPSDAVPATAVYVRYSDNTQVYYSDNTAVEYSS